MVVSKPTLTHHSIHIIMCILIVESAYNFSLVRLEGLWRTTTRFVMLRCIKMFHVSAASTTQRFFEYSLNGQR